MKATKVVLLLLAIVGAVACKYDDDALWDKVNSLDDRVSSIEKQLSQSNSEIQAIKTITDALQNKVYVKSVTETAAGYEILFTDGTKASIANGKDGKDGQNGQDGKEGDTPFIGEDGNWWIGTTNTGVQAKGEDGKDGQNGEDGKDGQDGQNGLTPFIGEDGNWWIGTTNTGVKATGTAGQDAPVISIKKDGGKYYWVQVVDGVESWLTTDEGAKIPVNGADAVAPLLKVNARGYWMISYDGGITYTEMKDDNGRPVKASGKNGSNGTDGDSFFRDVQVMGDQLVLVLANGQILVVDIQNTINDPSCPYEYSRINTDMSNSELFSATTKTGETLTYYGKKNTDGTALQVTSIEYSDQNGNTSILGINSEGYLTSITSNQGAIIDFEWISATTAIIKAHSLVDNVYITTAVDFNSQVVAHNAMPLARSIQQNNRQGRIELELLESDSKYDSHVSYGSRAAYETDDLPSSQDLLLWIYQCDTGYDAKNYLRLENASDGTYVGILTNYERLSKGNYQYTLPISSYPSKASHQELCENIDNVLRTTESILGGALMDSGALVLALNGIAMSTGIGMLPAVITNAIVFAFTAVDCGLQILDSFGGISGIMMRTDSEWYYKEYIISDLAIYPVGYNKDKTVVGNKHIINPTEDLSLITLDMEGDPIINSFNLNPSCPAQGQSYKATADYHCIPDNSLITISIVGTDGYTDSITQNISGSGTAVLTVPGAASGVYDLCTVVIDMPYGESINMQASLVFGN